MTLNRKMVRGRKKTLKIFTGVSKIIRKLNNVNLTNQNGRPCFKQIIKKKIDNQNG